MPQPKSNEEIVRDFGNQLGFQLTPSNKAMKAVRFARKALTEILAQKDAEVAEVKEKHQRLIDGLLSYSPPHPENTEATRLFGVAWRAMQATKQTED